MLKTYFVGSVYGIDEPDVLFESVGVSHTGLFFCKNRKKTGSVSCFETGRIVNLQR